MDKHPREPIKHTCPDIDRYIKHIKFEITKESYLKNMNEEELRNVASSMNSQLEICIDYLEELRDSNHALRMWGIEEADKVDELENKLEEADAQ